MGLILTSLGQPQVTFDKPGDPSGLVMPADRGFSVMSNQLADKGFLVTTTDDLVNWARTGSLMWIPSASPAAPLR
jgi:NADH-quinone oxidoreductase subunit B